MTGFSKYSYILFLTLLFGCSNPDEPHPKNITRFPTFSFSLLSYFIEDYHQTHYYDGYFESVLFQHSDSVNTIYENSCSFFNHLGDPILPRQPFSVFVNDSIVLDTFPRSFEFSNGATLDFSKSLQWNIAGGKDIPSFNDSIMPPAKVIITYPLINSNILMARSPFTLLYDAANIDSVYIQLIIFSTDTSIFYYNRITDHTPNRGSYEIGRDIIDKLPASASAEIAVTSIKSKVHESGEEKYLIRAATIDRTSVSFSD